MEVILKEDIENLGVAYDIVNVKPGFARNFLIPQGKAVLALPSEKEKLNTYLAEVEAKESEKIASAKQIIEKLKAVTIKIVAKVGTGDKLFGSINNSNLVEELEKVGVAIDRKYVKIPGNTIKRTGKYTAKVRLHQMVEYDYDFEILADETDKPKKTVTLPKKVENKPTTEVTEANDAPAENTEA